MAPSSQIMCKLEPQHHTDGGERQNRSPRMGAYCLDLIPKNGKPAMERGQKKSPQAGDDDGVGL